MYVKRQMINSPDICRRWGMQKIEKKPNLIPKIVTSDMLWRTNRLLDAYLHFIQRVQLLTNLPITESGTDYSPVRPDMTYRCPLFHTTHVFTCRRSGLISLMKMRSTERVANYTRSLQLMIPKANSIQTFIKQTTRSSGVAERVKRTQKRDPSPS